MAGLFDLMFPPRVDGPLEPMLGEPKGVLASRSPQGILSQALNQPLPMDGRLTFLPAMVNNGRREFALPGLLASAWNAFTAPGRAYSGNMADPVGEALNVAGMMQMGTMPGVTSGHGALGSGFVKKPPAEKAARELAYRIQHRPMQDAGGAARLHDLTPSFGEDIYTKNALQYFGSGDKREGYVVSLLNRLRGNPDAEVTIYRGVPKDAPSGINKGDWVTLHPEVAKDYGEKVLSMKVKASDITSWPDSLLEFGYFPKK